VRADVEQMVAALADAPGVMYRPPRLRKVFASKACRKSVMIGTALTHAQMCKVRTMVALVSLQIVGHLAALSNPWNCPHGRPTLRHVATLAHLAK